MTIKARLRRIIRHVRRAKREWSCMSAMAYYAEGLARLGQWQALVILYRPMHARERLSRWQQRRTFREVRELEIEAGKLGIDPREVWDAFIYSQFSELRRALRG